MTGILEKKKKKKKKKKTTKKLEPAARNGIYKCPFFSQIIRDSNTLPDSIISSNEGAEDGVARFTSLVRARD